MWQMGVILTANYAFLNYLVLVLGFLLLDDSYLVRFVPTRFRAGLLPSGARGTLLHEGASDSATSRGRPRPWMAQALVASVFLLWIGYSTGAQVIAMLWPGSPLPTRPIALLEPFRVANTYGLFAVMTPHRYEIEFQASDDGQNWKAYTFRYKPQEVHERPRIYAPYQPRFDWNLWFASLGSWQQSPIVVLTEASLLEGRKDVLGLFRADPFPKHPPRYVRAVLWQYWFSTREAKREENVWWRRQLLGTFAPTLEKLPNGRFGEVAAPELMGPPEP